MAKRNKIGLFGTDGEAAQAMKTVGRVTGLRKGMEWAGETVGSAYGAGVGAVGGTLLGGPIGGMVGATVGGTLGGMAGGAAGYYAVDEVIPFIAANTYGQITGRGDYHLSRKNKKRMRYSNSTNAMGASSIIQHRSYIKDITSSADVNAFKVESFDINPGLRATFPWLYSIAANFEEYTIQGMVFEFRSSSGDGTASAALGTVIMATEYNLASPTFNSKTQMENHFFAQSAKPSVNQLHAVECKQSTMPIDVLFVRSGPVPTGYDPRFYDIGRFQIASDGIPEANRKLGELWCTFQVKLKKPMIPEAVTTNSYYLTGFTLATAQLVLRSIANFPIQSSLGIVEIVSPLVINFKSLKVGCGYHINIIWAWNGGAAITGLPSIASNVGGEGLRLFPSTLANGINSQVSVGNPGLCVMEYTFRANNEFCQITINAGAIASGADVKDSILVTEIDPIVAGIN